ncbi:MAG TPA: hypothetical protein VHE80_05280 [Acidimicrobiales bacterium]|nr:hypothetical protein [Acidimicrobiales bacterium]
MLSRFAGHLGAFVAPHEVTVAEYLDGWLDGLQVAGRAVTTLASYRRNIRAHVVPTLDGLRLQALGPMHLDGLYARLLADGRRDGRGGLKPRSVRYVHTIIRKALSDARRKGSASSARRGIEGVRRPGRSGRCAEDPLS